MSPKPGVRVCPRFHLEGSRPDHGFVARRPRSRAGYPTKPGGTGFVARRPRTRAGYPTKPGGPPIGSKTPHRDPSQMRKFHLPTGTPVSALAAISDIWLLTSGTT